MKVTRVVIKTPEGIQVLNLAWSQLCELLGDITRREFIDFLNGHVVTLADGTTVKQITQ